MALPFRKAGGGFLNNVVGVITGFEFDTKYSGENKDGTTWRKLNGTLSVKPEGADEPVQTFVDFGFIYDDAIEVAGAVISGAEECPIKENTEGAGLVGSMVETGLDESEVGDGLDYGFLVGLRCNFVKVTDEDRNKRQGKRKDKKTGKEYNHELLRVSKVFGREDVKPAKKAAGAKKTAAAPNTGQGKKAAAAAPNTDAADAAIIAMTEAAKDKTIKQDAISGLFVKYALKNSIGQEDREPLRNLLMSDAYLADAAERGLIEFEPKGGKGTIKATE